MKSLKLTNCLYIFLASAFQAVGIYNVHAVADITEGGTLGATLLLEYWFHISPALSSFLMNAACFALGFRVLGKAFIGYSLVASVGYSACYWLLEQFPPFWPEIVQYPFLAAIAGAIFVGIGAGFSVRYGGAPSGDDALAMSISHISKVPIQWVYLISDLTVLLLSLTYIPLRRIAWSLLTVILSGQIIGWIQSIPPRKEEAK